MRELHLYPKSRAILVSVSGGLDSMCLLTICAEQLHRGLLSSVRAFHMNHGTRPSENQNEETLVREYCKQLGIPLVVARAKLDMNTSNFEENARNLRKKSLQDVLKPGEWAATAHTIDDSFEWTLMQMGRGSSLTSSLGIPVFAPPLIRPLLCLTRIQLEKLAKSAQIPAAHDPSNHDAKFLRSYVRYSVLAPYKDRFPQALRHYVARQNQLAQRLGVHRLGQIHGPMNWRAGIRPLGPDVLALYHPAPKAPWFGAEETLRDMIAHLSNTKRGEIARELAKLIVAANHGRRGPMNFSGGVKIWPRPGVIIMAAKTGEGWANAYVQNLDEQRRRRQEKR